MSSAEPGTRYDSPDFKSGWGDRPETPLAIAKRILALNRKLAEIEPDHAEIWPMLAPRRPRPGVDPGPILALTEEQLGELIDKRARFDPPRWPEPVDPWGYSLLMQAHVPADPKHVVVSVHAGAYDRWTMPNGARVKYNETNRIWADIGLGLTVLRALIDTMEPDWVWAGGCLVTVDDDGNAFAHRHPWLTWTAEGAAVPEYLRGGGDPAEVRRDRGGELRIWP